MNYLLLGPEEGEKNEWLRAEKARVLKAHPDAEVHLFYVGDDDGEAIGSVLSQSSLFSSFRYVVIRQYENRAGARDSVTAAITSYLSSGQEDAELVIVSSERSSTKIPKAVLDGIGKENIKMFWEMFESRKREWIVSAFRKEGFSIRPDAIEEILFSTENNTQDMKNLVSSLALYFHASSPGKAEISVDDIEAYAIKTRGEDGYTLFAAIAERDLEHAILIIRTISESDSYGTIRALNVLTSRFRLLESCLQMKRRGLSMDMISKDAEYLSPYPSSFKEKGIRKKEIPVMAKAMQNYSEEDARSIIQYLGRMDSEVKSAPSEMQMIALTSLIHTIILENGRESPINLLSSPLDMMI